MDKVTKALKPMVYHDYVVLFVGRDRLRSAAGFVPFAKSLRGLDLPGFVE